MEVGRTSVKVGWELLGAITGPTWWASCMRAKTALSDRSRKRFRKRSCRLSMALRRSTTPSAALQPHVTTYIEEYEGADASPSKSRVVDSTSSRAARSRAARPLKWRNSSAPQVSTDQLWLASTTPLRYSNDHSVLEKSGL